MSYAGIDIGTHDTKAAILDPTGKPKTLTDLAGTPFIPSVVLVGKDGISVGADAVRRAPWEPEGCIYNPKRYLGTDQVLKTTADGKEIRARDCLALLLAAVQEIFAAKTGEVLQTVVMTIPANYDDQQRQLMLDIARERNVKASLAHEPTAAAIGNGVLERGDGHVIVMDIGGGTTDGSTLCVSGNSVEVVSTYGEPKLGGCDINACIRDYVFERMKQRYGFSPEPIQDAQALWELDQRIEQAKVVLTQSASVPLVFSCRGNLVRVDVTNDLVRELCQGWLERLVACTHKTLELSRLKGSDFRELLVVGGAGQMRMVRDAIAQAIGLTPSTVPEPIHGAALGGAIMGRVELARQGLPMIVGGLRLPPPDLFIREITPYPLGITVLSPDGKELANDVIISKNSPVPCEMTRRYAPALAGQSEVRVELLQGDPQTSRERCLVLGHLDMCDLPKIVDRPHPIEVRVRIDRNGKATVTAQDTISGKCGEMTVDYKRGLPPVKAAA